MPYVTKQRRNELAPRSSGILANCATPAQPAPPITAGDLNFVLTTVVHNFVNYHGVSYEVFNAALGALEAAKLEFYRTVVAPYENIKRAQNGSLDTQPEIRS